MYSRFQRILLSQAQIFFFFYFINLQIMKSLIKQKSGQTKELSSVYRMLTHRTRLGEGSKGLYSKKANEQFECEVGGRNGGLKIIRKITLF
jgi:hypothetical protein